MQHGCMERLVRAGYRPPKLPDFRTSLAIAVVSLVFPSSAGEGSPIAGEATAS
jgi:hypothetical protein